MASSRLQPDQPRVTVSPTARGTWLVVTRVVLTQATFFVTHAEASAYADRWLKENPGVATDPVVTRPADPITIKVRALVE